MGVRRPRRQIDTRGRLLVGLGRQTGSVSSVDGRTVRFAHRRPQLLAAATDHVLEHGLADLRLRSIAEALGISHRTLLGHFSTKEQLVAEILAEIRRRDRAMILAESDRPRNESPSAVLMGTWRRLTCDERLGYWRLFFEAYGLAIGDPERFAPFIDGLVDDWLALTGDLLRSAGAQDEGLPALSTTTLLPGLGTADCADAAERLRQAVEQHAPFAVTISVGAATDNSASSDWSTLLDSADRRLYEAKARGRNCVAVGRTSDSAAGSGHRWSADAIEAIRAAG